MAPHPRRVPEAAVLIAVVLVAGPLLFLVVVEPWLLLDPEFLVVGAAGAALVAYPFCWWAIRHDPDPTTVFVPRLVGAAGLVAGGLLLVVGVGGGVPSLGALAAVVVGLPPVEYALPRLPAPPPDRSLAGGTALCCGVALLAGLLPDGSLLQSAVAAGVLAGAAGRHVGRSGDPLLGAGTPLAAGAVLVPAAVAGVAGTLAGVPASPVAAGLAGAIPGTAYLTAAATA